MARYDQVSERTFFFFFLLAATLGRLSLSGSNQSADRGLVVILVFIINNGVILHF
jgi:hypothetical protein